MSLSANAIITLADAKAFLHKQNISTDDDIIETVIEAVSATFQNEAGPDLKSVTYTAEVNDGTGKSFLYLPHYPVTTLTSVVEDGSTLVKDTDYFIDMDGGILEKANYGCGYHSFSGRWTRSKGGVVVTYVAGYATLPADIKLAALIELSRKCSMIEHSMFGETSRTVENVSITVNTDELLPATIATLGRYTRLRI